MSSIRVLSCSSGTNILVALKLNQWDFLNREQAIFLRLPLPYLFGNLRLSSCAKWLHCILRLISRKTSERSSFVIFLTCNRSFLQEWPSYESSWPLQINHGQEIYHRYVIMSFLQNIYIKSFFISLPKVFFKKGFKV